MIFRIIRAGAKHLKEVNRLIISANIGPRVRWPLRDCWVAKSEGKVVGFAMLNCIGGNAAVLEYLVVDRNYRHRGIGSALIEKRIEAAKNRGCDLLALATMYYLFNFYKKRGFRTCPRRFLPEKVKNFRMFTARRYMKCAVMIGNI